MFDEQLVPPYDDGSGQYEQFYDPGEEDGVDGGNWQDQLGQEGDYDSLGHEESSWSKSQQLRNNANLTAKLDAQHAFVTWEDNSQLGSSVSWRVLSPCMLSDCRW
jgi:hypothetical protein